MLTVPTKTIRVCGVLAVIGGLINAIADLLLRCGPVGGEEITHQFMATMLYEQTLAGAVLGGFVGIPMWLLILVPLWKALQNTAYWLKLSVIILFGYLFIITTIYHSVYAFYHIGHYHLAQSQNSQAAQLIVDQMNQFDAIGMWAWFGTALTGSILLIFAILKGTTRFKKWMVIVTPFLGIPMTILSAQLPAPIGGYIRPMTGTLVITSFFVLVAYVTWKEDTFQN